MLFNIIYIKTYPNTTNTVQNNYIITIELNNDRRIGRTTSYIFRCLFYRHLEIYLLVL